MRLNAISVIEKRRRGIHREFLCRFCVAQDIMLEQGEERFTTGTLTPTPRVRPKVSPSTSNSNHYQSGARCKAIEARSY
jgi:hypothetical protein